MSVVLDAAALIALLRGEPAAARVAAALREATATIVAVNLAETIDILVRREEVAEADVRRALDRLTGSLLRVVPVDEALAWQGALTHARRYHRTASPLSLSDCLCLAAAAAGGDTVLTSDVPMLRAAQAEGVALEVLPDSAGRKPAGF